MKNLLQKVKKWLSQSWAKVIIVFKKFMVFLNKNVYVPLKKILYKMGHNKALNVSDTHIIIFNKLNIKKTIIKDTLYKLGHNKVLNVSYTHITLFNKYEIKTSNKRRNAFIGLSFIFIWIVGYLIFSLYPVFNSLYLSLFKVRFDGSELNYTFLWFENYRAAFLTDPNFTELLLNYSLSMLLNVPVTIVFALIIAMLINQDIRGKGVWRTIFFIPVIIASGPVIAELMAQGATTLPSIEEYGFIDMVVENVGTFLANPIQALFDQILFVLWFAGIQILIFLAGLQKIDRSIYEAAMIDGASPWEAFWKITLPSIKPLITISIIYTVVSMSVFSLNEVTTFILGKMLGESTPAITTGYGYTATLSWIFFIVMALIILIFVGALNIRGRKAK